MANEGEMSEGAAAVQATEAILRGSKLMPERDTGENQPVEDFRLDPDVNPGVILYPTTDQIKARSDQLHALRSGKGKRTSHLFVEEMGPWEKLKIGLKPSIATDWQSKVRTEGYYEGQANVLENFLDAVARPDFGSINVMKLLDEYGYHLRLALLGRAQQTEFAHDSSLNPLSRVKQVKVLPEAAFKERIKGKVLGEIDMLRDVLGSLGQTAQVVQVERNIDREIAEPNKLKEAMERKKTASMQETLEEFKEAVDAFKDENDDLFVDNPLGKLPAEQEAIAKATTPDAAARMIATAEAIARRQVKEISGRKVKDPYEEAIAQLKTAIRALQFHEGTEIAQARAYEVWGDLASKVEAVRELNLGVVRIYNPRKSGGGVGLADFVYGRALYLLKKTNDPSSSEVVDRIKGKRAAIKRP